MVSGHAAVDRNSPRRGRYACPHYPAPAGVLIYNNPL